jgi:hypothetical protein
MTAISIERNTEKFNNLPADYQQAVRMSDYDNKLGLITKEHKLHIDQSATLESLLARLIFGEIESEDIISEMEDKINISNTEALGIAKEIDEIIIKPIKTNLQNIQTGLQKKEDGE